MAESPEFDDPEAVEDLDEDDLLDELDDAGATYADEELPQDPDEDDPRFTQDRIDDV